MSKGGITESAIGLLILTTIFCSAIYGGSNHTLIQAASIGDLKQIQMLLAKGVDVNARGDFDWTVLMEACSRGHLNIVKPLLENGAEVNDVRDKCSGKLGGTALMAAVWTGQTDVVKLLLENGADVNIAEILGVTVLGVASLRYHKKTVELLKMAGAQSLGPGYHDSGRELIARHQNSLKQVQQLLQQGAVPCSEAR